MNWNLIIQIIADYGLPFAIKLFELAEKNTAPTREDFEVLKALARTRAASRLAAVIEREGQHLTASDIQRLLALAGAQVDSETP